MRNNFGVVVRGVELLLNHVQVKLCESLAEAEFRLGVGEKKRKG